MIEFIRPNRTLLLVQFGLSRPASRLMLQNFKFLLLFFYLPGYPTHSECANIKGKNGGRITERVRNLRLVLLNIHFYEQKSQLALRGLGLKNKRKINWSLKFAF